MNQDVLIRGQEPADMSDITELLNQPRVVWAHPPLGPMRLGLGGP